METQKDVQDYFVRHAVRFNDLYGGDNAATRAFDRMFRMPMYTRFKWTIEHAGAENVKRVLDLGCGSGRYAVALAKAGKEVTGVDFSEKMLELARQYSDESGTSDKTEFYQADINNWMAETKEKFDISFGMGLFDYLDHPDNTLSKMLHVSDEAVISFPAPTFPRSQLRTMRYKRQDCPLFFYKEKDVENLAEKSGAKVVELRSLNGSGHWVRFQKK